VRQLVDELAERPERLAFDPRQFQPREIDSPVEEESERAPLKIGVVPGPADGMPGVPVDAIVEDSPGALAGVRPGDRIVRVGGRSIDSVYDYVRALREQAPDSTWRMIVERGGERVTLSVGPVEVAP
jgi:S1-C subfamily serine protease